MAIAPWAIKALIGVGGVSAVGVGGIFIHQGYLSGNSKNHLGWKVETKEVGDSIIVSIIEHKSNSVEWVCQIKTTKPSNTTKQDGIKSQIKEKLGIEDDGSIKTEKKSQFDKFVENCKRYKSENQQNNDSKITMDLGNISLDESGDNYKLNETEFNKTFEEIYLKKEYKESLGLPIACKIMGVEDSDSCKLNAEDLKKIKFEGKTDNTQTSLTGNETVTLKIEQRAGEVFPKNLRFVFVANGKDVTISSGDSIDILKKGIIAEFKVKTTETTNTLERIWDLTKLTETVGLNCPTNSNPLNTCTLKDGKTINVWNNDNSYIIGATFSGGNITVAKGQQNYNQGFKFTTDAEIALTESSDATKKGDDLKIEKNSVSYEIKLRKIPDATNPTWFLSKKTP